MLNSQQSPSQQQQKQTPNSRSPDQSNSHSYFIFDDLSSALSERNNNNNTKNLINNNDNIINKINQINNHASSTTSSSSSGTRQQQTTRKPPQFQNRFQYNTTNTFQNQQQTSYQHFNTFQQQPQQQQQQQQQKSGFDFRSTLHCQFTPCNSQKSSVQISNSTKSRSRVKTSGEDGHGNEAGTVNYHFKTLVPSAAAGAIIGKGGETIASLQKDAGARVKMSKAHDFYPGTSERVCLISGTADGVMTVLDFIQDKIREKPDLTKQLVEIDPKAQERDKQIKILVPNSTAGMIIGKAGAFIKQIKEESGSYVQISQKPKDLTLQERCITIIGEKENNKIAARMILSKIIEDPSSGSCLNVSYADINGPVANFNPTGSPFAAQQNTNFSASNASLNSALNTAVGGTTAGMLVNGTGINLSLNLGQPTPQANPTVTTQCLDHIKVAMRGSGYSESVTTEVVAALGILAKYGVLGIGVGLTNGAHTSPLSYLGVQAIEQSANAAAAAASGVYGAIGQVNLDSYMHTHSSNAPRNSMERYEAAFDPFRHGGQAATPISLNNNTFGLSSANAQAHQAHQAMNAAAAAQTMNALNNKSPTPADGNKESKNVEIPEIIVGAILGPGGRNLIEIQQLSGANVQISKKGTFAPGTRNRIVTITGQTNSITMAHYLIEQKINEEEGKRAQQLKVSGISPATAVAQ